MKPRAKVLPLPRDAKAIAQERLVPKLSDLEHEVATMLLRFQSGATR